MMELRGRYRSKTKQQARKTAIEARQNDFLAMKITGASDLAIAAHYECSPATVATHIKIVLEKRMEANREGAEQVREIQDDRLERLFLALWEDACNGDRGAIELILKVWEKRVSLWGLTQESFISFTKNQVISITTPTNPEAFEDDNRLKDVYNIITSSELFPALPEPEGEAENSDNSIIE